MDALTHAIEGYVSSEWNPHGDATSLQGGSLLQTPLQGADDEVYAVAQGPVSIGGFSAGGGGSSVTKNHPTTGRVPDGAIVERIEDVISVDVVVRPATTSTFRESEDGPQERAEFELREEVENQPAHRQVVALAKPAVS